MKSKFYFFSVIAIVAVTALLILNWQSSAQTSRKAVWEYKTYVVMNSATVSPDVSELNRLGADGWELIESRTEEPMDKITTYRRVEYIFKRMK